MSRAAWAEPVYEVAESFRQDALGQGRSVITGEPDVWAPEAATEFHTRFVVQEDLTSNSFMDKLAGQLSGASREAVLLAADLLTLRFLAIEGTSQQVKVERVRSVLDMLSDRPAIPPEVTAAFGSGIATIGLANTQVWTQMRFLAELARVWALTPGGERGGIMETPVGWKSWLDAVPHPSPLMLHAMTHLFFPDAFEPIVSVSVKEQVAAAFRGVDGVTELDDLDDQLAWIRSEIEPMLGEGFQFYDTALRRIWDGGSPAAVEFAGFARAFRDLDEFEREEIDYKRVVATRLGEARDAVMEGAADWPATLRRAFASPNNLTDWRQHDTFLKWCESDPDEARSLLGLIWADAVPADEHLRRFLEGVPRSAIGSPGARANILSFLLIARSVDDFPAYKATASDRALELCGLEPGRTDDPVERYRRFVDLLDELRLRVLAGGGPKMTRLEAQSTAWMVVDWPPPEAWSADLQVALLRFRGGDAPSPRPPDPVPRPDPLDELAQRLHLPASWLGGLIELLTEKRQMIFYGPPGTGKTLVAQELARHLTRAGGAWRLVQFHPSYSYEDFFEGYRPRLIEGQLTYELTPGPLRRIAEEARADPDNRFVVIVDEINRGNIPKIFGELLFLLEYRDQAIELQYSHEPFTLPSNLFIIGTMNTADRSIALVDAALRRRFYFQAFLPTEAPIDDVLRSWLQTTQLPPLAADLLAELNRRIGKDEISIGPSYFMSGDGSEAHVERVWRHAILPLLEEHYYGSKHDVEKEFGYATCRSAVRAATAADEARSAPDQDLPESLGGTE